MYKNDTAAFIATRFVSNHVFKYYPNCKGGIQSFTHWILICLVLNDINSKRLGNTIKILEFKDFILFPIPLIIVRLVLDILVHLKHL